MNFISTEFLVFSALFFALYPLVSIRHRILLLTAFSLFFYGYWNYYYIPLLIFSAWIDFYCASKIKDSPTKESRKRWLWLAVSLNAGTLIFFKYWNFFIDQLPWVTSENDFLHRLVLPLGISFYTLQTVGYTLDVYKGKIQPERNFMTYLSYVSFFPQLVAGPIERAGQLIPQLREPPTFDFTAFRIGILIVIWGIFAKIVIADNLSVFVGRALRKEDIGTLHFFVCLGAMFQVYCDFLGYSLIALGTAKAIGINLTHNFRQPFLAKTLSAFWQRWHITLTRWITDYIHIPLVRRYPHEPIRSISAIGAMCLVGLWHGASWNFIFFGLMHGVALRAWIPTANFLKRMSLPVLIRNMFSRGCLIIILALSAPLFMLNDIAQIAVVYDGLFSQNLGLTSLLATSGKGSFIIGSCFAVFILVNDIATRKKFCIFEMAEKSTIAYWAITLGLIAIITMFGKRGGQDFVYFQF